MNYIFLVIMLLLIIYLIFSKRQHRKEMLRISSKLDDIINQRDITIHQYQDTLSSKIDYQLFQVQNMANEYQQKVEEDRDEIKRLISEIAHQLRMPLANLLLYLELVNAEDITEQQRVDFLHNIGLAAESIHFLTDSFVKMSRLEHRLIQIKRKEQNLSDTINELVIRYKQFYAHTTLNFYLECPEKVLFSYDERWLSEALGNILDNAVKYSLSKGDIQIVVEQNEMGIKIGVRDFGQGIAEREVPMLFQRFYRGQNASNKDGFGLGLTIAREIITQHQGFIQLYPMIKGVLVEIILYR